MFWKVDVSLQHTPCASHVRQGFHQGAGHRPRPPFHRWREGSLPHPLRYSLLLSVVVETHHIPSHTHNSSISTFPFPSTSLCCIVSVPFKLHTKELIRPCKGFPPLSDCISSKNLLTLQAAWASFRSTPTLEKCQCRLVGRSIIGKSPSTT